MGTITLGLPGAILGCTLLAACAGAAPASYTSSGFLSPGEAESPPRTRMASATVLDGSLLARRSGNLLSVMRSRISNMRIQQTDDGLCPQITLRGRKTFVGNSNPQVYVNGQRANDTCILETTQIGDVDRIEVYPMGVAGRPGYRAHPYGLILVFLRTAD